MDMPTHAGTQAGQTATTAVSSFRPDHPNSIRTQLMTEGSDYDCESDQPPDPAGGAIDRLLAEQDEVILRLEELDLQIQHVIAVHVDHRRPHQGAA